MKTVATIRAAAAKRQGFTPNANMSPEQYRAWLQDELAALDVLAVSQQVLNERAAGSSQPVS